MIGKRRGKGSYRFLSTTLTVAHDFGCLPPCMSASVGSKLAKTEERGKVKLVRASEAMSSKAKG